MSARRSPLAVGFAPLADPTAEVLVLGSLPGQKSLEMRQYYAQPYNAFWPIMGRLFGAERSLPYPVRVERLIRHRVAVWDVLAAGRRSGSLDAAIIASSIVVNDFADFFARHEGIGLICFNGRKAAELYVRKVQPLLPRRFADIEAVVLPSTSPAHASLSFDQKLARWAAALGRER